MTSLELRVNEGCPTTFRNCLKSITEDGAGRDAGVAENLAVVYNLDNAVMQDVNKPCFCPWISWSIICLNIEAQVVRAYRSGCYILQTMK